MYVDIGQEEPLVVKAEAAVPVRHGERARIGYRRRAKPRALPHWRRRQNTINGAHFA